MDEYDGLCTFKREAEQKINEANLSAEEKVKSAEAAVAEWNRKFDEEQALRKKLEREIDELRKKEKACSENQNNDTQFEHSETFENQDYQNLESD